MQSNQDYDTSNTTTNGATSTSPMAAPFAKRLHKSSGWYHNNGRAFNSIWFIRTHNIYMNGTYRTYHTIHNIHSITVSLPSTRRNNSAFLYCFIIIIIFNFIFIHHPQQKQWSYYLLHMMHKTFLFSIYSILPHFFLLGISYSHQWPTIRSKCISD